MPGRPLTLPEANEVIQPLIRLPISLAWKGYGSAIFLELGELTPSRKPTLHASGEACIHVEWDWRVEDGPTVDYGSSNSGADIVRGLEGLQGTSIEAITIRGQVPELLIRFSNSRRLVSAAMTTGDPQWAIRMPDANWMAVEAGVILVGHDSAVQSSPEEREAIAHAERTANRWGTPAAEPSIGRCADCNWFVSIDGQFALLDFGVCTCSASPFDGRVVNVASGCGEFTPEGAVADG